MLYFSNQIGVFRNTVNFSIDEENLINPFQIYPTKCPNPKECHTCNQFFEENSKSVQANRYVCYAFGRERERERERESTTFIEKNAYHDKKCSVSFNFVPFMFVHDCIHFDILLFYL